MNPRTEVRPVPFARDLAVHGHRPALLTTDGELSYVELADRVRETAGKLGTGRRLVLLAGANTVDTVVTYLAALSAGHPVLLVPAAQVDAMVSAYDPDVVATPAGITSRRDGSAHELHPDLALLLSTSGSTGSPKLVRLSHDNVQANAEAIATYLDIRPADRAATTLPPHYCYGLSVINTHLLRGAALILTELSVVDPCFWELFRARGGTSFAGVPHTFDLLDRSGFADLDLPHLRYVTQAGGRLAPERVVRYAELGQRTGFDLYVMYGQTEATARMAYLPPDLARTRPGSIGRPVPGGSFRLEPVPGEPGTGELVYTGPNVMLGYAHHPSDLRLGRTVDELRTGDLARRAPDGLYELTGRRERFVKILGLRIDLDRVEALAGDAVAVGSDDDLALVVAGTADPAELRRSVAEACGLPPHAVRVHPVEVLPRGPAGKPDRRAALALASAARIPAPRTEHSASASALCRLYAEVLETDRVTARDSFTALGGDSLSYVEMSLRLERVLGPLPAGWHTRSIADLARPEAPAPARRRTLDTGVALRSVAIVLIVGGHITLFDLAGGAHLLLGAAGFNFARYHLTDAPRPDRLRRIGRSVARIAVPSVLWIALAMALTGSYGPANLALAHGLLQPDGVRDGWHFWFIETLVLLLLATGILLSVPALDRLERRTPFGLPVTLVALGLITRYDLPGIRENSSAPLTVCWLFALGWAAAKATGVRSRLLVTVAVAATLPGFFGNPSREAVVIVGLVLLVWVPRLPSFSALNLVAKVLAGASLYIYLTHWQVYPLLENHSGALALITSLAAGVVVGGLVERVARLLPARRFFRRRPSVSRERPAVRLPSPRGVPTLAD